MEKTKERRGEREKEHFQSPSLPRNNTQIESESWFVLTLMPRSKYLEWLKLTTLYILLAVGPSVPSTYILWNHHPQTIRQPFKAITELSITTSKNPLADWLRCLWTQFFPRSTPSKSPRQGQQAILRGWTMITELHSLASPTLRTVRAKKFSGSNLCCLFYLINRRDKVVRFSITVRALAACQILLVRSICKKKKAK